MAEIEYRETDGAAVLTTDERGEWIESDSVALLSEWL
jgi:hypothetical protein